MSQEIILLMITAATLGFVHTALGPDHYLPFVVLGKARNWGMPKTLVITLVSGLGHVLSSILIGAIGIALGIGVSKLEIIEAGRGEIVGWLLTAFGLLYMIWGIRRSMKNKTHEHRHFHADGSIHEHNHGHTNEHAHIHEKKEKKQLTAWVIFLIFVFGPCEPLIPLLMYPASKNSVSGVFMVSLVFALTTVSTMMLITFLLSKGIKILAVQKMEKHMHTLAGATIFMSGFAISVLGL